MKLPKRNLLILLSSFVLAIALSSCGNNKKELVDDLIFLSVNDLTQKYGEPSCCTVDNSVVFTLENDIKARVFYKDDKMTEPEVVRINGMDFDPELFYSDLDWDLPHLNWQEALGKMTVTGLHGIKEATYNKKVNTLNIVVDNPIIETFGKRKR